MIKNIAICDSGVGGLFLLDKLYKNFENFNYVYICDKQNLPYGNKSESQIKEYCLNAINTAIKFNANLLIVACNTMSEIGEEIFLSCKQIPVLFVRHDLRKILASNMKKGRFFCTVATAKSKQISSLKRLNKGFVFPLKNLALQIENNALNLENFTPDFLNKSYKNIFKVYLGCTHYPLILNKFKKSFPNATFYDGSEEIIRTIKNFIYTKAAQNNPIKTQAKKLFVGSGNLYALKVFKSIF